MTPTAWSGLRVAIILSRSQTTYSLLLGQSIIYEIPLRMHSDSSKQVYSGTELQNHLENIFIIIEIYFR